MTPAPELLTIGGSGSKIESGEEQCAAHAISATISAEQGY